MDIICALYPDVIIRGMILDDFERIRNRVTWQEPSSPIQIDYDIREVRNYDSSTV